MMLELEDGGCVTLEIIPGVDHALAPFACCDQYEDGRPYPKTRVRAVPLSHTHDTYHCEAIALCCGKRWGRIAVRVETMFGIEEDEAMLKNGRARVYHG